MIKLAPSILSADFNCLGEEIQSVEKAGAEYIHIDVMDGVFVPSISYGIPVIKSVRRNSKAVFDLHLMITEPDRYIRDFAEAGADIITVHAEGCTHLDRTIQNIRENGCKAAVALNPATSLNVLDYVADSIDMVLIMSVNPGFGGQKYIDYSTEKIKELKEFLKSKGSTADIEVDGGITLNNVRTVLEAGANVIVAGSAVYKGNSTENVRKFINIFREFK